MNESIQLYMIEGGPALDMIKKHIKDKQRAHDAKLVMLQQLGLDPDQVLIWASRHDGTVTEIALNGSKPKGFKAANWTKPDSQGRRHPKKGTEEAKIFYTKEVCYEPAESLIAQAFKVPLGINYKTAGGSGSTAIGRMMSSCGFLWLTKDGPYAMWTPDVKGAVRELQERHKNLKSFKVLGGVAEWKLDVEGVRPILQEEWDLLVAQKNLAEAQERQRKQALFDSLPDAGKKNITDAVNKAFKGKKK